MLSGVSRHNSGHLHVIYEGENVFRYHGACKTCTAQCYSIALSPAESVLLEVLFVPPPPPPLRFFIPSGRRPAEWRREKGFRREERGRRPDAGVGRTDGRTTETPSGFLHWRGPSRALHCQRCCTIVPSFASSLLASFSGDRRACLLGYYFSSSVREREREPGSSTPTNCDVVELSDRFSSVRPIRRLRPVWTKVGELSTGKERGQALEAGRRQLDRLHYHRRPPPPTDLTIKAIEKRRRLRRRQRWTRSRPDCRSDRWTRAYRAADRPTDQGEKTEGSQLGKRNGLKGLCILFYIWRKGFFRVGMPILLPSKSIM